MIASNVPHWLMAVHFRLCCCCCCRRCCCCWCSEYADFRVSSDGELQGVGLLIANEPYNNHLLVLSAIKGGPADRAGMTTGGGVSNMSHNIPFHCWAADRERALQQPSAGAQRHQGRASGQGRDANRWGLLVTCYITYECR
jgi:hypothetical protein